MGHKRLLHKRGLAEIDDDDYLAVIKKMINKKEMIVWLIENNYLNEERFAKAYAGGKFRMKQWGRIRIGRFNKHELKMRGLSEYCIKVGLAEIDEDDYLACIH